MIFMSNAASLKVKSPIRTFHGTQTLIGYIKHDCRKCHDIEVGRIAELAIGVQFMKGLLFSNYLMGIYLSILSLYCLVTSFISPCNKKVFIKQKPENINKSDKHKIRDVIHFVVFFAAFILAYYFVIKLKFMILIYVFISLGILLFAVTIPYVIWSFIHYIIIKPFDYELTEERKSTLGFAGIIMVFVCGAVAKNDVSAQLGQFLSNVEPSIHDFILMAILTIWYFAVLFFTLTFFILSAHDINIWIRNRMKNKRTQSKRKPLAFIKPTPTSLANIIIEKIDAFTEENMLKKVLYNILWFISLLIDILLGFSKVLIEFIWNLIIIIVFVPPKLIRNAINALSESLSKNQGKSIIIISRVSLISALIIVYLVDKYMGVFSGPGSDIFEFMCSVIIIPIIITQIIDLKSKQNIIVN